MTVLPVRKMSSPLPSFLTKEGVVTAPLIPLSEEKPLILVAPTTIDLAIGEQWTWEEVIELMMGETRLIQAQVVVSKRASGKLKQIVKVPAGAQVTMMYVVTVAEQAEWRHEIVVEGEGEVIIRRQVDLQGESSTAQVRCSARMLASASLLISDEAFSYARATQSDVQTKVVLRDQAKSQARGRIVVSEQSIKSVSYERLDHLLIGEHVRAAVIPELEVKTDDVKCGHGATTSRPQESEIFYLMSRGLSLLEAEKIIEDGFFHV